MEQKQNGLSKKKEHSLLCHPQWLLTVCQIKSKLPSQAFKASRVPILKQALGSAQGPFSLPLPNAIWASRCCPITLPQTVQPPLISRSPQTCPLPLPWMMTC